ncbi:MAG: ABC transporter substrate binding protein, partial [Desulfomonilia bacterium]
VTDIEMFDMCFDGFKEQLAANGIIEGKNCTFNRRVIKFDAENAGLLKKIGLLREIKKQAASIVQAKPDLVLTIGTPATKYAKDTIIAAGIPLVFTGVAIPEAAGCKSVSEAGPGFTGSTLWMDMKNVMDIFRLAFPSVKTVALIHSEDDNAIAQVQDAQKYAPAYNLTILARQIERKDSIRPVARELMDQGAEMFWIPLDTYYGLRDLSEFRALCEETTSRNVLIFSLTQVNTKGGIMAVGSHFPTIGAYSGQQAARILLEGVSPESLPILRQEQLLIRVDEKKMAEHGLSFPKELLMVAKPIIEELMEE